MIESFCRWVYSYFDSPIHVLLSVACLVAWAGLVLSIVAVYPRGAVVIFDCPGCNCARLSSVTRYASDGVTAVPAATVSKRGD